MKAKKYVFLLVIGFLKRIYWILPTLILDPFDIAKKLFDINYNVPLIVIWNILAVGCMIAVALTVRDIRNRTVIEYFSKLRDFKFFDKEIIKAIQSIYSFKGRERLVALRDIISKPGTYEEYIEAEMKSRLHINVIVVPRNWRRTFPGEYPEKVGTIVSMSGKIEKLIISSLLEKSFITIGQNRIVEVNPEFSRTLNLFLDQS